MAKKTPPVRRTFTSQFKKDAVALVQAGRSLTAVAHDLGIARSLLARRREQLGRHAADAFPGTGRLLPAAEEVRRLRQQLRDVTEDRDILKSVGLLRGRPEVKFHFMAVHRQAFRLRSLCRVLGVSPSGYYAWCRRPVPRREQRHSS